MKKIIKCIFIALIVSTSTIAQEQIDLFILAGQSNAQGWKGNGASYPSDPNNIDPQIRLNSTFIGDSDTGGWVTMQAQPGRYDDGHFGLEVNFSRKLKQAGYNPAFFKYSKGSSGLQVDWKKPGAGGYYDDMVIALRAAILELENLGHTVNVKCFVWIQGEEDAKNTTYTAAYENNLLLLINDLRNNVVNNSSLPMIIGSDFFQGMQVIDIQKSIADNDDNIVFTSMVGLQKADNTHLTPAGLVAHGQVVFNDYKAAFGNDGETATCTINSVWDRTATLVNQQSWGQSFEAECAGILKSITFNSAKELTSGATLYVKDGTNCNAATLHTQVINVNNADNEIILSNVVSVKASTMYYFQVVSNNGETFPIRFIRPSQVTGNLSTHAVGGTDPLACDTEFTAFDWGFSVVIDDTLSIGDISSDINQSKIYPNPTTNKFTITESKNSIIEVYDLIGKRIMSKKIESDNESFDISDFNNGIYFVKINNNGNVKTMKIIKK